MKMLDKFRKKSLSKKPGKKTIKEFYDHKYAENETLFSGNGSYDYLKEHIGTVNGRVLDLGCGQGRDSILFAKDGCEVVGVDFSQVAVNQLNKKAIEEKLTLRAVKADILTYQIDKTYNLINAHFSLQFLQDTWTFFETLKKMKNGTLTGGYNYFAVPISKESKKKNSKIFTTQDINHLYSDWEVIDCSKKLVNKMDGGKRKALFFLAKKP